MRSTLVIGTKGTARNAPTPTSTKRNIIGIGQTTALANKPRLVTQSPATAMLANLRLLAVEHHSGNCLLPMLEFTYTSLKVDRYSA
jgi:hypothetical protein